MMSYWRKQILTYSVWHYIYPRVYLGFKILKEYLLGKEWLAVAVKQLRSLV
jgi:hypothetical protein